MVWNKGISWKKNENILQRRKIKCGNCGKGFWAFPCEIERGRKKYCSRKCYELSKRKKHHLSDGYVRLLQPQHPHCMARGYVLEHRIIMEKHIGRYLNPTEAVHHINGKRDDNRINNLMLFPTRGAHTSFHHSLGGVIGLEK